MRILVIGAGASGLVTAKYVKERGHEVQIVEAGSIIGGTFENKRYKHGQMVSSKYLTCFSDFRAPKSDTHMTLLDYAQYLRDYATHFGLDSLIRFGTRIETVKKNAETGKFDVAIVAADANTAHTEHWDAVAICSGLHNVPQVPQFPGLDQFKGKVLHSSEYKDPVIFEGKDVLVVGTGETAFDVGYHAATLGVSDSTPGAKSVTMSTRHGFVSVPAYVDETLPPLDCVIMNWATHGWESKFAMRTGMHWWITTKFTRLGFFISSGTTYGFNQWVGKRFNMTWDEGRKHIVNKSAKCMPLLSRKVKRECPWWKKLPWWGLWDRLDPKAAAGKDIDLVVGSITSMQDNTVSYKTADGPKDVTADVVVLATGYRQKFPFLHPERSATEDDPLPSEHYIVNPEEPRLAYIGFIRPNVGAIPPMSELQAMWWLQRMDNQLVAKSPDYYKLHGRRLEYGVDYGYYMFALAREIGSIPRLLSWIWRDPRVFVTCAFGQAHVPIFKLDGPFASKEVEETCAGELWRVILRRPVTMNTVFVLEAIALGAINAVISVLERPAGAVAALTVGCGFAANFYNKRRMLSM